ncbi:MAG: hypothetical protein HKN28_17100, partial [Alphaproteobacteria bacterium]|nr:hypothetical protein [Alphaproteobacteria bacterium]
FKTPPLLTTEQTAAYKNLRGYAPTAPAKIPSGDSPHNMKGDAHGGH